MSTSAWTSWKPPEEKSAVMQTANTCFCLPAHTLWRLLQSCSALALHCGSKDIGFEPRPSHPFAIFVCPSEIRPVWGQLPQLFSDLVAGGWVAGTCSLFIPFAPKALDSMFETTSLLPDHALMDVVGALGRNLRRSSFWNENQFVCML